MNSHPLPDGRDRGFLHQIDQQVEYLRFNGDRPCNRGAAHARFPGYRACEIPQIEIFTSCLKNIRCCLPPKE